MVAGVDPGGAWGAQAPPFGTNAEVLRYCFAVQQANENCVRKLQISDDTINSRTLLIQKLESSVKQGRIQRLKKGGAHIECFWCGHAARAARGFLFSARIMHSVVGGCGGMLPQENF